MALEAPKIPHVIGGGILPCRGKLVIGGSPKANKSWLAINMAINMAYGEPLFNKYEHKIPLFPVYKHNRILYMENEIGLSGLQERLRPVLGGRDLTVPELFIKSRDLSLTLDSAAGLELMSKEIEQVRPDVVIIDPLAQYHSSDENSAREMGIIMKNIDKWMEFYGTAVIIIHHTGHVDPRFPRSGGDRLRGSTAIYGAADSIILVDLISNPSALEPQLKLEFTLRRGEPRTGIRIKRLKTGVIQYLGAVAGTERERVDDAYDARPTYMVP